MKHHWSFDKRKHVDGSGEEWMFLWRFFMDEGIEYGERPVEVYFRNASRTYFGFLRFEHSKDNPYKYEKLVEKVVRSQEFRDKHSAPETKDVWSRNWK
jgi:hypothetical protein